MTILLGLTDLRSSHMSSQFEGHRHGEGAEISFFVTNAPPGSGPRLHTHPYAEVFIVQEGEATFTAGDDELVVGVLLQVSIHDRGEMQTTWLEE